MSFSWVPSMHFRRTRPTRKRILTPVDGGQGRRRRRHRPAAEVAVREAPGRRLLALQYPSLPLGSMRFVSVQTAKAKKPSMTYWLFISFLQIQQARFKSLMGCIRLPGLSLPTLIIHTSLQEPLLLRLLSCSDDERMTQPAGRLNTAAVCSTPATKRHKGTTVVFT